ncbi:MAG: peptidylprolyl isomerase [Deltaproteobacteria bacterium]|nr:peptidylprolyl isomerase [Deltaproteobacteria bacterium]
MSTPASTDPCTGHTREHAARDLLDLALSDAPLTTEQAARCLAHRADLDVPTQRALRFMLARRLPTQSLAAWWDTVPDEDRWLVLRGLAGRPRSNPPTLPPIRWQVDPLPSSPLATLIGRFRLTPRPVEDPAPHAVQGLASASINRQIATARWVQSSTWLPSIDDLAWLSAQATPAMVRAMSERPDRSQLPWGEWLALTARRAHLAPRLWGNAWRSLRDGLPVSVRTPANVALWLASLAMVPPVRGLTEQAQAYFVCEDALALDRWSNTAERTPPCASGDLRWIADLHHAKLLREITTPERLRAQSLVSLRAQNTQRPPVLIEVAQSAVTLRQSTALPIVQSLLSERDPGVVAAVLEGLVAHEALARALPRPALSAMIDSVLNAPEGPALEAQLQAIQLLQKLRWPLPPSATQTRVRALQSALADGGATLYRSAAPSVPAPPRRVLMVTDAGSLTFEVIPAQAPRAAQVLFEAIRAERYNGLRWHRVVPGFVTQGGDPRGDGYGGTDHPTETELSLQPFERGAVGVPLAGLDTGGIQLFFVTADSPHLDGRYPWLGRVLQGLDVLDGILPGDRIQRVEFASE